MANGAVDYLSLAISPKSTAYLSITEAEMIFYRPDLGHVIKSPTTALSVTLYDKQEFNSAVRCDYVLKS